MMSQIRVLGEGMGEMERRTIVIDGDVLPVTRVVGDLAGRQLVQFVADGTTYTFYPDGMPLDEQWRTALPELGRLIAVNRSYLRKMHMIRMTAESI